MEPGRVRGGAGLKSKLKTALIGAGIVLGGGLGLKLHMTRASFDVFYAGGSADNPFILAKHYERDMSDNRRRTGNYDTLVFQPGFDDAVATLETVGNPLVYGGKGDLVWLNVGQAPLLFNARTGATPIPPVGDLHAALANGFKVAHKNHAEFAGPVHVPTGALAVTASNSMEYVVKINGSVRTWEEFIANYPSPELDRCRGHRVCGSEICVTDEPDPGGGTSLLIDAKGKTDPFFNPVAVGPERCVPRLGDDGPLLIGHNLHPGASDWPDYLTAVNTDGTTVWATDFASLFGEGVDAVAVGLAGDSVVLGAAVNHWWWGKTAKAVTLGAAGKREQT